MRSSVFLVAALVSAQPLFSSQQNSTPPAAKAQRIFAATHGHPMETNGGQKPGPAPAVDRGGGNAGWIIGAAAGAALVGGIVAYESTRPQHELGRHGPQMPGEFSMSGFRITAFTQANWPVGLDFLLDQGGTLTVAIQVDRRTTYTYTTGLSGARIQTRFRTPSNFPRRPTPAVYTITATDHRGQPLYLHLFGLAAGPRAVGSIAIDEVHFGPNRIRPKTKQEAVYTFHTHTDFDRIQAEFLRSVTANGELTSKKEDEDDIKHVLSERDGRGQWNGKKASPGEHMLQLRGWESSLDKANWVIAWSTDLVEVEE